MKLGELGFKEIKEKLKVAIPAFLPLKASRLYGMGVSFAHKSPQNQPLFEGLVESAKTKGFNVETLPELFGMGKYIPKTETIKVTKGATEILAHELGHTQLHKALPMFKYIKGGGAFTAGLTPLVATFTDKKSSLDKYLPFIAAAGMSPTLISEALASKRGLDMLREMGANPKIMRQAQLSLGKFFSTYGLTAATLILAPYLISKLKQRHGET